MLAFLHVTEDVRVRLESKQKTNQIAFTRVKDV